MQRHIVGNEPHPYYDFQDNQRRVETQKATNDRTARPTEAKPESQWEAIGEKEAEFAGIERDVLTQEERDEFYKRKQMNPEASDMDILLQMKKEEAEVMSENMSPEMKKLTQTYESRISPEDKDMYHQTYDVQENPWNVDRR